MSMSDPPTPLERAAAERRHSGIVRRGGRLRRRRRFLASSGAALASAGLAVGILFALPGGRQTKVNVISPPTTSAPNRSVPASTSQTTVTTTPPTTALPISQATTQLNIYLDSEAARETAAAQAAGQSWYGYLHTPPVADAGGLVAVAAFSYDPNAKPLQVLGYANGKWSLLAALPTPPDQGFVTPSGAAMNSFWLPDFSGPSIQVADVTGDGRPDFLIPLNAADNLPGAVVSQEGAGASARWRYVPLRQGSSVSPFYVLARSPEFRGSTLVSTYDNCTPSCAQGTNYTITWTYERNSGVFWAPNPP